MTGCSGVILTSGKLPCQRRSTRIQCSVRPYPASTSPTNGMLFSIAQAATQAWHPVHKSWSMTMPQRPPNSSSELFVNTGSCKSAPIETLLFRFKPIYTQHAFQAGQPVFLAGLIHPDLQAREGQIAGLVHGRSKQVRGLHSASLGESSISSVALPERHGDRIGTNGRVLVD